jgi:hypothetical protein
MSWRARWHAIEAWVGLDGRARWLSAALIPALLVAWGVGIAQTGRWPSGDGPHVLGASMRLAQLLWDGELGRLAWCFQSLIGPHPPGAYVPSFLTYSVLGTQGRWTHLVAGALVAGLCLDGVRRLGGGLPGWVWLLACPLVWLQAEAYGIDLVGAACVVQCLSHLAASKKLTHRVHSVAWGAWLGAAFMVKYTAPMFLWAPCVLAGVWVVRERRWKALGFGVLGFAVVAGPWYATHLGGLADYLSASSGGALLTNTQALTGSWAERAAWYPLVLTDSVGWLGLIGAVVALAAWPRRKGVDLSHWAIPALGVLGGVVLLSLQSQRQGRYLLPALPLIAAVIGSSKVWPAMLPASGVGLYGTAMIFLTWTDVPISRGYAHTWDQAAAGWPWPHATFQPTSFDRQPWELHERLEQVRHVHGSDDGTVAFLLDDATGAPPFGVVLSAVAARGYRWPVATIMVLPHNEAAVFVGPFTDSEWPPREFSVLVSIFRPGDAQREAWLRTSPLQLVDSWPLPEGMEGRIYQSPDGPWLPPEPTSLGPPK